MLEWHRLLGLTLMDFFTDSPYRVELEKDLSLRQQLLDVAIIRQEANGQMPAEVPDGLENLTRHNLLTYKSMRQPLDGWTLDELVAHYVNYRKQMSASLKQLSPVEDFSLYAVTTRAPEKLATQATFISLKEGVGEVLWGSKRVRVIIISQVPQTERNALWQLFSGTMEKVQYGAAHYRWRRDDHSGTIHNLFKYYNAEGMPMPYTWDDYFRDITREHLNLLTKEELTSALSFEERLKGLPVEERLKGLPVETLLQALPAKDIEAYVKKLRQRKRKKKPA